MFFTDPGDMKLSLFELYFSQNDQLNRSFKTATFLFLAAGDENSSSLHDINLGVKKGALVAVVGTVGSGKSSLLACILGEMPKLQGKVLTISLNQNQAYCTARNFSTVHFIDWTRACLPKVNFDNRGLDQLPSSDIMDWNVCRFV